MRIHFKNITLHNFLSFVHATLRLDRPGYTLIQGKNNNPIDNAYSNGSGKSALLEAIAWALTGETIRGSKDVLRITAHEKNNSCYVLLNFIVDNNEYEIYRQSNPSKLTLKVNGADISGKGIRDTDKILKEYLPSLTTSLLGSVIILGQGLPQRFSNNTPSGRKEVLEQLSNSDVMITDLKLRISNRKKELEDQIRVVEDNILKHTTQKEMFETELNSLEDKIKNLPNIEDLKIELDKSTSEYLGYQLDLNESSDLLNYYKNDLQNIDNDIKTNNIQLTNKINEVSKPFDNELANLTKLKISIETEIKVLKSEINKLKNIKDICPTCGQKLPGVEKPSTVIQEQQLLKLQEDLATVISRCNDINDKKSFKILEVKQEFEKDIADLNDRSKTESVHIKELEEKILQINKHLNELQKINIELDATIKNYQKNEVELKEKVITTRQSIETLTSKILYNNNDKDNLLNHLTIITKMNNVVSRDFRGYLLTSVIDFINRKAKEYSQEVFETDRINFCLDGNNISISYDNKEYENLSGGEKQKVDLIVQFAIRDMLCKYLNFSSNIIAVDELFDNLDSIGCEKVLNLISNRLNDVETIYIVTHHASIPIPFDNIWTVVKGDDGISRINAI